jgi:hypothetical protein
MLDLSWRTLSPQAKGMRIIQPMAPGQRASHAMSRPRTVLTLTASDPQPELGAVRVLP